MRRLLRHFTVEVFLRVRHCSIVVYIVWGTRRGTECWVRFAFYCQIWEFGFQQHIGSNLSSMVGGARSEETERSKKGYDGTIEGWQAGRVKLLARLHKKGLRKVVLHGVATGDDSDDEGWDAAASGSPADMLAQVLRERKASWYVFHQVDNEDTDLGPWTASQVLAWKEQQKLGDDEVYVREATLTQGEWVACDGETKGALLRQHRDSLSASVAPST